MRLEDVIAHHADRTGYDLVSFAEVTLPVYKLQMTVSLLLHTPLSPTFEFVLRAIRLGIDDAAEIALCLGIPVPMVAEALRGLHQSEEVAILQGSEGPARFTLTRKGERTTTSLERIRPERQSLSMLFDGLTRRPIAQPVERLLSGRQAEDMGMIEIPALPASRIEIAVVEVSAAARLLAKERVREGRRDLLSIKSIDRRMRLHMPAVALVYRDAGGGEIELMFVNETAVLDEHNRAFAQADGPRKTRLLSEFGKADVLGPASFAGRLVAPVTKAAKPSSAAGKTVLGVRRRSPGSAVSLSVRDFAPILREALAGARSRLLILSPWITSEVVDADALLAIGKLLERGVELYIGYGMDDQKKRKAIPPSLETLSRRHPNFTLCELGNTHEKVLIKDDDYIVSGSFNWLSFRGDPHRTLRHEHGLRIHDPEFVEKEFAKFQARLRACAAANNVM